MNHAFFLAIICIYDAIKYVCTAFGNSFRNWNFISFFVYVI
jgi:hypothetical protein